MRTSTGLLAILVAALLASATIPSPVRTSGWQELKDRSMPGPSDALIECLALEANRWRQESGGNKAATPDVIGLLYGWLLWPMGQLEMSFW